MLCPFWESKKQTEIDTRKHLITLYQSHLKHLTLNNKGNGKNNSSSNFLYVCHLIMTAPYFRPSASKADEDSDFVPINLHLQKMRVFQASGKYYFFV